jgi:predicted nucleic-acid-binding Zn-ribbon protein
MWSLNSCPRCGGDTYIDEEIGLAYEKCLQCGYERELVKVSAKRHEAIENDRIGHSTKQSRIIKRGRPGHCSS